MYTSNDDSTLFFWGIYICLAFVAGVVGSGRQIGFFPALLLGLFLSPVIGLIFAFDSMRNSDAEFQRAMAERIRELTAKVEGATNEEQEQ